MKSKNGRYFLISMFSTFCFIALLFGLVVADYNTRWVGFGVDAPIACIVSYPSGEKKLEVNTMGIKKTFDITRFYKFKEETKQGIKTSFEVIGTFFKNLFSNYRPTEHKTDKILV